jgi:nitrogen regulatory protein PII
MDEAVKNEMKSPEVISSEAPYRTGMKFTPHFTDGIELEMIVLDFMVKLVFDEIIVTLSNGLASDGRIFVRMFLTHMILEQKLI